MGARTRRFVATIGVLLFLTFWVWGAVSINDVLPNIWWLDLLFFAVAGIGWGIPLIPMLRWAERDPDAK
ncbi:MAG: DUF2842 domain-containing protein [Candidatus Brevundimonas phytovorans]|nr:DUF2842 domain-containing protein [Brevundimonas sp.]WEK56531.1 MAG: DUF2842 domain-containing protein [Brevundimonas sp.]